MGRLGRSFGERIGGGVGVGVTMVQLKLSSNGPTAESESLQSFWGLQEEGQVEGFSGEIPQSQ